MGDGSEECPALPMADTSAANPGPDTDAGSNPLASSQTSTAASKDKDNRRREPTALDPDVSCETRVENPENSDEAKHRPGDHVATTTSIEGLTTTARAESTTSSNSDVASSIEPMLLPGIKGIFETVDNYV